ncbi:MAG: hypothetical protein ABIW76_06210 [Fibrobacteria bacterium]
MLKRNLRFYLIGLIALVLSLSIWNCNTTELGKNFVLNLTVSDSLSIDKGNYDSIRLDLMDSTKVVFRPAIFQGAYVTTEHPGGLHFELGNNVPVPMLIVITGHRKDGKLLISSSTFENGNQSKANPVFSTTPTGVRIQPDGPVTLSAQGDSLEVSAQVLPVGATANVIWKSVDTSTAIIQNGIVIPRKVGNTQIIAMVENTLFKDTLKVVVTTLTRPDSLRLNTQSLSLALGAPDTLLIAKVSPDSLQTRGLVWKSSDNTVATVSASGAVKIIATGNAMIIVNSSGFSGISDTCHITVTPRALTQPESLQLNLHTVTLFLGEADTLLKAQIFAPQFQSLGAVWSSSDTNVATVSILGMVKAKTAGKTLISAAITGYAGIYDTCRVTIMLKPTVQPDSIRLKAHTLTLTVGMPDSLLQAKISPDSLAGLGVVWKSSDTTVAKFVAGKVKPIAAGNAFIVVSPAGYPAIVDTCRVTIMPKPLSKPDSVRLNARTMTLYIGGPDSTLTAKISPDSLTRLGLVWNSSDTTLAKVAAGKVKAIAAGNVFIIASPTGFLGSVDTCRVTVKKDIPTLTTGPDRSVILGGQLVFNLKVIQEFGGVAALKWDLDGDNVYEDSVKADTASPKRIYPAAGNFTAHFYVRDGEGNIVTRSLTVHVGSAPLVIITSPAVLDTTVNLTPISIKYTVNGSSFTKSVALVPGPNPVVIDSITPDGRGYDSLMVNLDMTPPSTPIFTGTTGSFTTSTQPTWTWTSPAGGGGNGTYQIKLDGNPIITQTSKSYQPGVQSEGAHTLTLQERDAAGNWSTPPASFIWKVDLTAPTIQFTAPVVSGNYLTKASSVHVAGTASDLMGLGSVAYVLTGASVDSASATGTSTWAFDIAAKEGATIIKVIAKDLSGRTATASITLTRDQTRPKVTLDAIANDVKITSKDIPVAGSASDLGGSVNTLTYSLNTGSAVTLPLSGGRFTFTPACPDGDCSVMVLAVDVAGNRDSQTVVIHKRNNVIFVRKGITGGDGSSWAKAFGELSDVIDGVKSFSGKKIWVSAGLYNPTPSVGVFYADNSASLFGGFKLDGTQFSENQRNPLLDISELSGRANPTLSITTRNSEPTNGFTLDGFRISNTGNGGGVYTSNSTNLLINHCSFIGFTSDIPLFVSGIFGEGKVVKVNKSIFQNNTLSDYAPIHVMAVALTVDSSDFRNNTITANSGAAITSYSGSIYARNSYFINDKSSAFDPNVYSEFFLSSGVTLDIDHCSITNGELGILGSGTIIYGSGNKKLDPP